MPRNLLYISTYQFQKKGSATYAFPAYADQFWDKYLDMFETITVLGEEVRMEKPEKDLKIITDKRINVQLLPYNARPGMLKADSIVRDALKELIEENEFIIIKANYRKGLMAIDICKKLNKTYIVAFSGDMRLDLLSSKSLLRRLYAPILHRETISKIKDAKFGLYVTDEYLQNVYPIAGEQCGCTNTILKQINRDVLEVRIKKIQEFNPQKNVSMGLVGTYSDNRKGIDTAIIALSKLIDYPIKLHVLGVGKIEDQRHWMDYAKKYKVEDKLVFDTPLKSVDEVLLWNDCIDIIILPSRSEGLPRCIIESMSRACPCVISNVCGMPELVNKQWIHDPEDSERLAELLEMMMTNVELMKRAAIENYNRSFYYEYENVKQRRNKFLKEYIDYIGG